MAVGRVRDRGGLRRSPSSATSWPTWPRPRPRPASPSSPATPRWWTGAPPTACTSRPPGVGVLPRRTPLGPELVQPGDVVLVSGTIADHGMAVMLARGDLALEADIRSDTAPLGELVEALLAGRARRPAGCATRPAAGSAPCATSWPATPTWPSSSTRPCCPIDPAVTRACDLLGIDPLYVANEGKLVAVVAADEADAALAALRAHPLGADADRGSARSRPTRRASSCCSRPSAAPASSTCSSATRCRASAERAMTDPCDRLRVTGTVQGVGFRPFVYRHAVALGLAGCVLQRQRRRAARGRGRRSRIAELARRARGRRRRRWPGSRRVTAEPMPAVAAAAGFPIVESDVAGAADVAGQRRHRHVCRTAWPRSTTRPTAATATRSPTAPTAGPGTRSSLGVPYDRPATTMAGFTMCAGVPGGVRRPGGPPVPRPAQRLPRVRPAAVVARHRARVVAARQGRRGAGRGGRRAASAARSSASRASVASTWPSTPPTTAAVAELRRRKARDDKPFAVMVADLGRGAVAVRADERPSRRSTSPRRPIVLAPRRPGAPVADGRWRPGCPTSASCSPYSPLHHLLLAGVGRPLVMTSGNLSDEPIAHDGRRRRRPARPARRRRARPRPGDPHPLRRLGRARRARVGRSRCCAGRGASRPEPVPLVRCRRRPVLAVGAELKSTVSVANGGDRGGQPPHRRPRAPGHVPVVPPGHRPPARALRRRRPRSSPTTCTPSTSRRSSRAGPRPARRVGGAAPPRPCRVVPDRARPHRARCSAWPSTASGYGPDGTLWGGELLVADLERLRAGRPPGRRSRCPGGVAAIREPWRMARWRGRRAAGVDGCALRRRRRDAVGGARPRRARARPGAPPAWAGCSTRSPRCSGCGRR